MHCAACWEQLEQEEDLQDKIVIRVHRVWGIWGILQERIVAPTSEEELAVTGKSSVGKYPCPTGVQPHLVAFKTFSVSMSLFPHLLLLLISFFRF